MALHAEVRTEYEHLVGTVSIGQQPGGAGRNAESFAMPLKDCFGFAGLVAEPVSGNRVFLAGDLTPADFLDRVAADLAAQCLAYQLSAQAVSDHWHIFRHRIADQRTDRIDPR